MEDRRHNGQDCRELLSVGNRLDNLEDSVHTAITELKSVVSRVHELEVADGALGTSVKFIQDIVEKHAESSKKFQRWMFAVAAYLTIVATDPFHQAVIRFIKVP